LTVATAFASVVLAPKDLNVGVLLQTILNTAGISNEEKRSPLVEGLAMMLFRCSLTLPIRDGELVLPVGHDLVVVSWGKSVLAPVPLVLSVQGKEPN
jgi:ABC-type Co2+ transport system permease subunit